jgi:hypothetical protein
VFTLSGDAGGSWYLHREADAWRLTASEAGKRVSETTIPQEIAWRLFTKGIAREAARQQITITGDQGIGRHVLTMRSIVG